MFKFSKRTTAVAAGILSLALSRYAFAEHFDFDPGVGDPFNPNLAASGGKPYDWYYQGINLDFGSGLTDGREDTTFHDNPYGNIPYFIFDGTDQSAAGHCLQVDFAAPRTDAQDPNPVRNLSFSFVDANGNDEAIFGASDVTSSSYLTVRMWIQNTGGGLYWHTKIADLDGTSGTWNQGATMNIWRLDQNQADCTTNLHNAYPNLLFVTFIGTTGNYKVCRQDGSCFQVGGAGVGNCAPGHTVSLKANVNGKYCSAQQNGSDDECNRTSVGPWEQYDIVDAGGGWVGLKAHANNLYLSADMNNANKLVRAGWATTIGSWEKFQIVNAGGGMVGLKANANGLYVQSNQNMTNYPLLAQGASIGTWEHFICQ